MVIYRIFPTQKDYPFPFSSIPCSPVGKRCTSLLVKKQQSLDPWPGWTWIQRDCMNAAKTSASHDSYCKVFSCLPSIPLLFPRVIHDGNGKPSPMSAAPVPLTVPSAPCATRASHPDTRRLSQCISASAQSVSPSTSSQASCCTHHVSSPCLSPSSSTSHFIYNSSPQAQLINKALLSSPNPSSKIYVHHDAL